MINANGIQFPSTCMGNAVGKKLYKLTRG